MLAHAVEQEAREQLGIRYITGDAARLNRRRRSSAAGRAICAKRYRDKDFRKAGAAKPPASERFGTAETDGLIRRQSDLATAGRIHRRCPAIVAQSGSSVDAKTKRRAAQAHNRLRVPSRGGPLDDDDAS